MEAKLANIRRAVEDGFADACWANARIRELLAEQQALAIDAGVAQPPSLNCKAVIVYRGQIEKLIKFGEPAERKRLMRTWVQGIKLEPDSLEVKITYRLPEGVMKGVVAGACNVLKIPTCPFEIALISAA